VLRVLLATLALAGAAPATFHDSIRPLSSSQKALIRKSGFWHRNCPVSLNDLRVVTVSYRGFDHHTHSGQLVVNRTAAANIATVFRKLYALHFPIHHMKLTDMYGPLKAQPKDGDVTGAFDCRQAVPSPCVGGTGTGSWSMHAFGLAVDVNPVENPYVGCGATRDPSSRPFRDRSRHRPGMVTHRAIGAFASVGWGWGGSWSGSTKDYMHFSSTGH
jgi:D-alanyl-D-alanine carboxypeptidase